MERDVPYLGSAHYGMRRLSILFRCSHVGMTCLFVNVFGQNHTLGVHDGVKWPPLTHIYCRYFIDKTNFFGFRWNLVG